MSQSAPARISMLLAALCMSAALVPVQAQSSKKEKPEEVAAPAPANTVRPELFKLVDGNLFKADLDAKKYDVIKDRLAQGLALPNLTPFETYIINNQRLVLASAVGDNPLTITILETILPSSFVQKPERIRYMEVLASLYFAASNYPKAIETIKAYQAEAPEPGKLQLMLSRAYPLNNDYANGKIALEKLISDVEKSGKIASKEDLNNLAFCARKLKDDETYLTTMEKLAANYPTPEYWTDLLSRLNRMKGYATALDGHTLRLMSMVMPKLPDADYYTDLAELVLNEGYFTEAKQIMDAGYASGLVGVGPNAAKHKVLRDKATKQSAEDIKDIAKGEASAAKAKDGAPLVKTGFAYVTMGDFDKGLGLMQQGIAKGVTKRPADAQLLLGVAYYKAGKKDEALKAFAAAKSEDGVTVLARYWTNFINYKPAAAAPAAAAAK